MAISPDNGVDGRMGFVRITDEPDGLKVAWTDTPGTAVPVRFVERVVAKGLSRTVPHLLVISMKFVEGPDGGGGGGSGGAPDAGTPDGATESEPLVIRSAALNRRTGQVRMVFFCPRAAGLCAGTLTIRARGQNLASKGFDQNGGSRLSANPDAVGERSRDTQESTEGARTGSVARRGGDRHQSHADLQFLSPWPRLGGDDRS